MAGKPIRTAKTSEKAEKKELHSVDIRESANGGHIVRHNYANGGMEYSEPQEHTFGAGEGDKVISHVAEAMHLKVNPDKDPEETKRGEAAAAGE